MKQIKTRRSLRSHLAIANDFNGVPPTRPPRMAVATPPQDPSLTVKFNRAAKNPKFSRLSKQELIQRQIAALRREMSQPRVTLEFGTTGSVNKARNPKRDRLIQQQIIALTKQLNSKKAVQKSTGLAGSQGKAKQQFNRAAQGMSR